MVEQRMFLRAVLNYPDRNRVFAQLEGGKAAIPYLTAVLRKKNHDIEMWRRLAVVRFFLPPIYSYAIFSHFVSPSRGEEPLFTTDSPIENHSFEGYRERDQYLSLISELDPNVANDLRDTRPDSLPKSLKKRKTKEDECV